MPFRLDSSIPLAIALAAPVACASDPAQDASRPATAAAAVATEPSAWVERLEAEGIADRFVEATGLFLGTPYENGPLGEGEGPDPDPRVDFARADCVTYLEQALALALVAPGDDFLATLDAIRYRDGEVDFVSRNHYMVTDWIPANDWLVEDVTGRVAPGRTERVVRTIDRRAFLEDQGVEPRDGVDGRQEVALDIVPIGALSEVEANLTPGDLVFWVGKRDGIFVTHTGLAVRDPAGELIFRHASSKAGQALDESFADYASRASWAAGFLVLRLRDEPARRPAAG